ncbi:MAG: hypothetical protein K2I78_03030 [Clostridia bacterium]|nr:hypothetical protein [Clostridia bacterium]MDE7215326.1 hypothetical protein [Clostridia bacterium]
MKKKLITLIIAVLVISTLAVCLTGCNVKMAAEDAWTEYDEAIAESLTYAEGKDYYVKYKYKDEASGATVTQKLNVTYVNSYIDDWDEYILVNRQAEKSYTANTEYVTTYYGYALKSGVKARKSTKEDYFKGYFYSVKDGDKTVNVNANLENDEEFFSLKAGDSVDGKQITADEEIAKYTLANVLATLDGLNKDTAELLSATKNGTVVTLNLAVKDSEQYYGKYNDKDNSLTVQITKGRITKISNSDGTYFINYAGPKINLVR